MHDPNLMWGIDDGEQVRQDVNKVTEEAVKRVQSGAAQAKQIQAQIKKDRAINNNIAGFLQVLLKQIKNEDLVTYLYKTFFIVTNPKTWAKYYKKQVNNVVIVWFFAPFFWDIIEQYKLQNYFEDIKPTWNITLASYIDYIKQLSKKHHDNIPVDKDSLLNLLCLIIMEFGLSNNSITDQSQVLSEIKQALQNNKN